MPAQAVQFPRVEYILQPEPFTLLFAEDLMTPKSYLDKATGRQGAPRYSCQIVMKADHPKLGLLYQFVQQIAAQSLPGHPGPHLPIVSGDELNRVRIAEGKKPYDVYTNAWVLRAASNERTMPTAQFPQGKPLVPPRLVVMQNGTMTDYLDAARPQAAPFFYSGVEAVGIFKFQAYTGMGGGVTCYVERIMSLARGERIAIGKSNEDAFGSADSYTQHLGHVTAESIVPPAAPPAYAPPQPGYAPPSAYAPPPGYGQPQPQYAAPVAPGQGMPYYPPR